MSEIIHCDKHGPYEVRRAEIMGVVIERRCCSKCIEDEDAAERAKREDRKREDAIRRWEAKIGCAGIPERFRDRTIDSYIAANAPQRAAAGFSRDLACAISSGDAKGRCGLFIGLPGTGKTHLAVGVAMHVMAHGKSAMFATVMRAIRTIKDSWRKGSDATETSAIAALSYPDLLILDEVGVQFGSEAEKILLFDVLNERYEQRKSTILLSNLNATEVTAYLGERIIDRLREDGGQIVVFDWESYRGRK